MYLPKILLVGATGNVGQATIRALVNSKAACEIIAAVRDVERGKLYLGEYTELSYRHFDFDQPSTFAPALEQVDVVFLMRPPSMAEVLSYFRPLIKLLQKMAIPVVFLSVHGAQRSRLIPHNRIERLIKSHHIPYTFVRPSYFMQNLTTTLYQDIRDKRKIVLPAGNAVLNWIDVEDIAKVLALILVNPAAHHQKIYELTGSENLDFYQVAEILNRFLRWRIRYRAMNPLSFYWKKRQENYPKDYLFVLTMLHVLPRFRKRPLVTNDYRLLTGESPSLLQDFAKRNAALLDVKGNDL